MKYVNNDKGFALVLELLLGLAVVGVLGVAGYRIYTANQQAKTSKTVPATSTQQPTTTPATAIFKISELNVEMVLPAGLSSLTYAPMNDFSGKLSGYGVTSAKLLQIDPACTAAGASIGVLSVDGTDVAQGQGSTVDKKDLGNGKALFFAEPNGSCFAKKSILEDQAIFEKDGAVQSDQTALLKQAILTAKYSK